MARDDYRHGRLRENAKKEARYYILIYVLFLMSIFILTLLSSCKSGTILEPQVYPDSIRYASVFNEIVDTDSSVHWYSRIYEGSGWCYYHHRYEEIKIVRR
jgi:hypothetical protein